MSIKRRKKCTYPLCFPRKDIDPNGTLDVSAHGDAYSIDHLDQSINAKQAADIIRRHPEFTGQPIRLLSCNTGAKADGVAQQLANEVGVIVWAPENYLWAHDNGGFSIGPGEWVGKPGARRFQAAYPHKGKFVPFAPQKFVPVEAQKNP